MPFVNTRTIMGEQAAFDALVAHQLSELNDDGVTELGTYALYRQNSLTAVNFPSLTKIGSNAFDGCANLETIDIGSVCSIQSSAFANCPKLKSLILRGTSGISTLANNSVLMGTNFNILQGGIYVPQTLLSSYRSNSNWGPYKAVIQPIENMPVTDFSTISMTWSQLKAAIDDETFFSAGYAVGDIKQFTYGQHTVYAEIRKIDTTNKHVDFVIKNFDETVHLKSSSTMIKYSDSLAKARLDTIYADELPSDLKAAISSIAKKYYAYDGTTEEITVPLWLLNTKDAGLNGVYLKDSEGENYFPSNTERIKYNQTTGSTYYWWLGSAYSSSTFANVDGSGYGNYNSPGFICGLVFGFRIKKSS